MPETTQRKSMSFDKHFKRHDIHGKPVFVVDDHHKALVAWALHRRSVDTAPILITLDHHTDTHEGFMRHAYALAQKRKSRDAETIRRELIDKVDWRDDGSLLQAIQHLAHDEHIETATATGILGAAFCIQFNEFDGDPRPLEKQADGNVQYEALDSRIFAVPSGCFIGCTKTTHDTECQYAHADQILESIYLDSQLSIGDAMGRSIGLKFLETTSYILDIDLDVFHSRKSIEPADASTFYRLIKNAAVITIATEEECVEEEWLDDEPMSANELLERLMAHIDSALTSADQSK